MASPRVAVIGSTGQLGSDAVEALRGDGGFGVIALSHAECDCTNAEQVYHALQECCPDIVINCAAYVRVDDCEDHAEEAFKLNAVGALHVARICAQLGAHCVYISTDYVFGGNKPAPYVESDVPEPINVYGASKLVGEYLVRQATSRWLIVRMASLFGKTGARGKGGNFVETIIAKAQMGKRLRIVDDVRMSPTYTRDAAAGIVRLLKDGIDGTVHLANDGACTWYEFAKQCLELAHLKVPIEPIPSEQYLSRARRPKNSTLQSERSFQKLRPWQEALSAYMIERGK